MSTNKVQLLSACRSTLKILKPKSKSRFLYISIIQASLGLLDVIGVALLGAMGAIAIRGKNSEPPGNLIKFILSALHLQNFTFQKQIVTLGALALIFLITKTFISIFFSRKILHFLANESTELSDQLFSGFIRINLIKPINKSTSDVQYIVQYGSTQLILGVLGTAANIVADGALLLFLTVGLAIIDPLTAILAFGLFSLTGALVHKLVADRASKTGREMARFSVEMSQIVYEVMKAFKEIYLRDGLERTTAEAKIKKGQFAQTFAEQAFLPNISKYVFEMAVTVGGFVVAGVQFAIHDTAHAVAGLTVFVAAGSRIAPSIMRIQQSYIQMRSSLASSHSTLDLMELITLTDSAGSHISEDPTGENPGNLLTDTTAKPAITVNELEFRYESGGEYKISVPKVEIKFGEMVAIVGPSGAGKSTLVSLLAGIFSPSSGKVRIGGLDPKEYVKRNPGKISYVPQEIYIAPTNVSENLYLALKEGDKDSQRAISALDEAHFSKPELNANELLNLTTSEDGGNLSGGERQRLGIARAFYTNPQILILDEATSSLDGLSEENIMESIFKFKGKLTVIIIAHRLSTISSADKVIYMNQGNVQAVGSIQEVREQIPEFDTQAERMGLR